MFSLLQPKYIILIHERFQKPSVIICKCSKRQFEHITALILIISVQKRKNSALICVPLIKYWCWLENQIMSLKMSKILDLHRVRVKVGDILCTFPLNKCIHLSEIHKNIFKDAKFYCELHYTESAAHQHSPLPHIHAVKTVFCDCWDHLHS